MASRSQHVLNWPILSESEPHKYIQQIYYNIVPPLSRPIVTPSVRASSSLLAVKGTVHKMSRFQNKQESSLVCLSFNIYLMAVVVVVVVVGKVVLVVYKLIIC